MTFGAMAAWQAWLLIGAAGAAAAWLFLRKLRPPRVIVPSLLLWRRVLDEARELTLWERIRRAVSLVVTVVVALALAFGVTRPSRRGASAAAAGDRRLIVIDSSWSMRARTKNGERRWDRAIAEARRLIASGGEVALATTADGLVEGPSADLALLETALDRVAPSGGESATWPRLAGADAVHFITDGALTRPLTPDVIVHSVFEPAPNVAVTALDVRPSTSGANVGDAYLEVANYAPSAQAVRLTLTRGKDTVLERRVDMAAGEALRQMIPLVRGADPVLHARVEAPANALDVDDEADAWVGGERPLHVRVVSPQADWLRGVFDRDPGVRATVIDPASYVAASDQRNPQDTPDIIVFDRWAPQAPATTPALYIAPPTDTPWLIGTPGPAPVQAADERKARWETAGEHPVVRGVDPFTLIIERAHHYGADLLPVATSARGTPLVSIGETDERRFVLLAFGPGDSNLANAPGFPVLIGNVVDWLAHPLGGSVRRPGPAVFDTSIASLTDPEGAPVPLVRIARGAVARLRTPGVYIAETGGSRSAFAVNVGDPQVSNLQRQGPAAAKNARVVSAGVSGWPWWMYCAVAAFVLAAAEWWTWQRRITV